MKLRRPMERLPEMIDLIKKYLYRHHFPKAVERYQTGHQLDFEALSITRYGLIIRKYQSTDDYVIYWKNIRLIDVQSGNLVIHTILNQSIRIPILKIQNLDILIDLIQQEVIA
jgi:hypothetical protein